MRSLSTTATRLVLLFLGVSPEAFGQGQQGSGTPYSAYGFGTFLGATQVDQALMGGTGIALADPFALVLSNPASYPSLALTNFQSGAALRFVRFDTETSSNSGRRADLLGFTLGVPFGKGRWGLALGLNPVSDVGYQITDKGSVNEGEVTFEYSGNGGLNRAFVGLGRTLWQSNDTLNKGTKVSFGANLNYLFGTIEELRKVYYPFAGNYYNSEVSTSLSLRAPTVAVGVQWTGDLLSGAHVLAAREARRKHLMAVDARKEQEWLDAGRDPALRKAVKLPKVEGDALRFRVGLTADLPAELTARNNQLARSFVIANSGAEAYVDTAWSIEGARGTVGLPVQLGLGATLYNSRWTVTAEHRRRDWTALRVDVEGYDPRTELASSGTTALGVALRPAGEGGGPLYKRMIYRAGLRYTNDYLVVAGTQLNEIGMSFGLSLPVMGSTTRSRLNFGTELGQRGTANNGLIQERFATVYVGLSVTPDIREQWFKKRRIE